MPPSTNISYGQSGDAVKQLQNFLIGQGMSIPDGATGYFGNETKAALAQWQSSVGIGPNTPGYGTNWGARSISAASSINSNKAPVASNAPNASYANASNVPVATTPPPAPSPTGDASSGGSSSGSGGSPSAPSTDWRGNPLVGYSGKTPVYDGTAQGIGLYSMQGNATVSYGSLQGIPNFAPVGGSAGGTGGTGSTAKAPNDPSNAFNTQTGQPNPNYNGGTTDTTTTGTTDTSTQPSSTTGQGIAYDPSWAARGITQASWNSLNATQQAMIATTLVAASSIVSNTGHTVTMSDALKAAATDPTLLAKYADQAGIDKLQFSQTLDQIRLATSTDSQTKQAQFEADRKALAEQSAAAGQAYSGYRGKAEQNLATSESGIVASSRSALQKQLNDATSAFEAKYGTSATTPATSQFINPFTSGDTSVSGLSQTPLTNPENLVGATAGGITGSQVTGKQQDINTLASQYVAASAIPNVIPA